MSVEQSRKPKIMTVFGIYLGEERWDTLGLLLFAGTNFSDFHYSLIWPVLILADL